MAALIQGRAYISTIVMYIAVAQNIGLRKLWQIIPWWKK